MWNMLSIVYKTSTNGFLGVLKTVEIREESELTQNVLNVWDCTMIKQINNNFHEEHWQEKLPLF